MIEETQRGEYFVLPIDGSLETSGPRQAKNIAHVFVRDAPRNRLELWQACRIGTDDPGDSFLIEGGREYLRKRVFHADDQNGEPLEIWLRVS